MLRPLFSWENTSLYPLRLQTKFLKPGVVTTFQYNKSPTNYMFSLKHCNILLSPDSNAIQVPCVTVTSSSTLRKVGIRACLKSTQWYMLQYRQTAKFSGVDLPIVSVVWNSVHIEYYHCSESCRHFLAEMVAVFSLQLVFLLLCYYITFADYSFPLPGLSLSVAVLPTGNDDVLQYISSS